MQQEFFEAVWGDATGWVSLVNRNENNYDAVDSEHWRHWPEDKTYISRYCAMRADEDTYCSVALFSNDQRTKDDSRAVAHAVWADADTCNPDNFRLYPSVVVQTSENRWHCWWVLDLPVAASEAAKVSQKIAYAHREQGCDLGWFASKILRVPGTTNLKDPDNPFEVTASYTGEIYTLDQLNEAYADIETDTTPSATLSEEMPALLSYSEQVALEQRVVKDAPFENLYMRKPEEGEDWSDRLFRLQFDLFREGCTPQEVFTLSYHAACNKFKRDNRPDSELWKTVRNAYRKYVAEAEGRIIPPSEKARVWSVPEFLTEGERALLPETFVDQYTKWVATKSDSAETYQRTAAFMILSSVFGDRGFLPDPSGKKYLNLWAIIAGKTTRLRKTTAKNFALDVIEAYELNALGGERINIGSDTTKEGLGKILGDRDGKVSLIQTDEVSGMFREFYGKNYQVGTISYFTDLYGGSVPVVIRASKDAGQLKRAKTIFNLLGVGIQSEIAEVLTRKDFESGFLPRVLWSIADPPPRAPGSDDYPEGSFEDSSAEIAKWAFKLKQRASKFNPEKPSAIYIDEKAKNRYNLWAEQVRKHAESFQDDALEAAVSRFQDSVRKSQALLAMYDGETVVRLQHVLAALAQAELWYGDLLRMLDEVSASAFERLQKEVENYISQGKGGVVSDSSVRRKFARLRPQEIDEVLNSLKKQGRIRSQGENGQLQVLA